MLWWVRIMVNDSSGGGSLGDLWLSNFFGLTLSRLNWTPPEAKEKKVAFYSVIPTSADASRPGQVRSESVYLYLDRRTLSLNQLNFD